MSFPTKRISNISPHNPHNSALNRTSYRNVVDKRARFHNDQIAPDIRSAAEFLERIWALYEVARHNAALSSPAPAKLPSTGRAMSRRELFWFQIFRPDFNFSAGPQAVDQVAEDIDGVMRDGMLPNERKVVAMLEAHLGEPVTSPVRQETLQFNRSLQPTERFRLADQFFNLDRPDTISKHRAATPFIRRQIVWRGQQSFNACQALCFLERDLRRKSPVDLRKLETRYHVGRLPQYDQLPLVAARTARLAICMASVEPVTKNSWVYRLDLVQAALVARKYNGFLAAQKIVTVQKGRNPRKPLILKEYLRLI